MNLSRGGTNFSMPFAKKSRLVPNNHSLIAAFTPLSKWHRRFEMNVVHVVFFHETKHMVKITWRKVNLQVSIHSCEK